MVETGGGAGELRREPEGLAHSGNGQVRSLPSVQNSLIFLYKYHCRFASKPFGSTTSGRSDWEGVHEFSLRSYISNVGPSETSRHDTVPMLLLLKLKCWYPITLFRWTAK